MNYSKHIFYIKPRDLDFRVALYNINKMKQKWVLPYLIDKDLIQNSNTCTRFLK